jgi:hypothetical protein
VLPNEEQLNEDGLLEAAIDGVYVATSREAVRPATVSSGGKPGGGR